MGRPRQPDTAWLSAFSRELRRIDDFDGLVDLVREELKTRFGLTNAWLYVFEEEEDEHAVLVAVAGAKADQIRKELPVAPIAGDWLTAALRRDEGPIVISDARAMEGNPDVARRLDNRTVVNMPIGVVDRALGVLGGGTFGDEGPVAFDADAIAYMVHLANMASVAVARLVLRAREAARLQPLEASSFEVISKPFDPDALLRAVRATLDAPRTGPPYE